MNRIVSFLFLLLASASVFAQAGLDFTFENTPAGTDLPDKAQLWGNNYSCNIQTAFKHQGENALELSRNPDAESNDFGCFVFPVPVSFVGKSAQIKVFMKSQDITEGMASIFVRVDGSGSNYYFANNLSNLKGTNDWYEFNTPVFQLGKGAEVINMGVILTGKGKVWVDDFTLLIDGKDYLKAPRKKGYNAYPADIDTAFSKSSGINIDVSNRVQVENLALLCKTWGFLKYYHPAIAAGKYNWDNELFRFLPTYLPITDQKQRNDSLLAWINKLGPVSGKGNKMKIKANTKLIPALEWIADTTVLGPALSAQLVKTRNTKRSNNHYYVSLQLSDNPDFQNERRYPFISWNDDGFRLLTVFRYYNMIEYFYPYKNLIGEDWHNIPNEFILKMIAAKDETEAQLVVYEMVARLNDTHAWLNGGRKIHSYLFGLNNANYTISFVENKAVVTGYLNQSLIKKGDLEPGDIIIEIDGEPVSKKVDRLKKYLSASNDAAKLRLIAGFLLTSNNRGIPVTYIRDGKKLSANLPCHTYEALADDPVTAAKSKDPTWRFITPEIGYIFLGTANKKELQRMMGELRLSKGIIIDARCYPSDFLVFNLSSYFHIKKTPFAKFSKTNLQNPGLFNYKKPEVVPGFKDAYNGKLVILVNEETMSSAEYHVMSFRSTPIATVVGSTTSGADGNVSKINLPGGFTTSISGLGVYYPDGTETQRVGIVPDVTVTPTLLNFIDGRDEMLEKAVQIIEEK